MAALIASSWASLAREYPLSGNRSVPTTESATWWPTPAAVSAATMLRDEVRKQFGKGCKVLDDPKQPWNRGLEIDRKFEVKIKAAA